DEEAAAVELVLRDSGIEERLGHRAERGGQDRVPRDAGLLAAGVELRAVEGVGLDDGVLDRVARREREADLLAREPLPGGLRDLLGLLALGLELLLHLVEALPCLLLALGHALGELLLQLR